MFEKFTERARKVMILARQEALSRNSEFIGTEHILIGIIDEGGGVGAKVLKGLNVGLSDVRSEVEKLITPSTSPTVTLGQLPFSPRAKNVFDLAYEEASRAKSDVVSTGHLLIGLHKETEGIACQVLGKLGVGDFARLRAAVWHLEEMAKGEAPMVGGIEKDHPTVKVRIRLFKQIVDAAGLDNGTLIVGAKSYAEGENFTLAGVARDKIKDIASAISEKHGTDTFILVLEVD